MDREIIKVDNIDMVDGILYSDIKHLLNNKTELENVLFTTKILFLNNEELMEFINKLMEYGYDDMALDYVENLYHNQIIMDFSKLKRNENPHK